MNPYTTAAGLAALAAAGLGYFYLSAPEPAKPPASPPPLVLAPGKAPPPSAAPKTVTASELLNATWIWQGAKVEAENFYAVLSALDKGYALADADDKQHAYVAWKFGQAEGGRVYSAALETDKAEKPGAMTLITLRFTAAGGAISDHECVFDPHKGGFAARAKASKSDIAVKDGGAAWTFTCRAKAPAGASDFRVHIVPAIGPALENFDPAQKGVLNLRSLTVLPE